MKEKNLIRMPVVEDEFYPKDPKQLKDIINNSLNKNNSEIKKPFGLIVPYESYKIASQVYGEAYSLIKNKKYETIILISPLHKIAFYGVALSKYTEFYTPLGNLNVDAEANAFLNKYDKEFIQYLDKFHEKEYAIEVQLPYIASINKNVKILPIIIGETNTKFTLLLAKALTELIKKDPDKYLIVTTTNLSQHMKYEDSSQIDNKFLSLLELMNPDSLSEQLAMRQVNAFGGGAVITLLRIAEQFNISNIKVLKYLNTFSLTQDKFKTNGFMSACLW